ncbi:MAG: hypothetical protein U0797_00895 [Gemmataceae bacterium]
MANGRRGGVATQGAPPEQPKQPRRPEHEVRLGRVKAAIWANDTEHGVRYGVTVSRVYKDKDGKWQTSESFSRDELLLLAKVSDLAHTWICEATSGDVPF